MSENDINWVLVYETDKLYDVEIVKGMLADNNITAVVVNKQDSAYHFGFFELYVANEDAMTSRTLILNSGL